MVRPARPRHAARPAPVGRRVTVPTAMAAALFVGAPAGTAIANDEPEPPHPLIDELGSTVGTATGTDRSDENAEGPATAEDLLHAAGMPAGGSEAEADAEGEAGEHAEAEGHGDAEAHAAAEEEGEAAAHAEAEEEVEAGATTVTLTAQNGSGVHGTATIDAERVVATATGMDPKARYVSFFYGATSSATNNNPCILDGTNPLPSNQTIGQWVVDEEGNGTLSAPNPLGGRYLLQAGTMSIRKVQHGFSKATALPVNPLSYSLVACGEVQRIAVLDPVTSLVPKLPKLPSVRPLS